MPDASRLPRTVAPNHYVLELEPDLAGARFSGSVRIDVDIVEPTRTIVLHARDLDVELVSLAQRGGRRDAQLVLEPDAEQVRLHAARELEAGPAELHLRFSGSLSDGLVGLYRSRYTDAQGVERTLAATQFEAPHARRAFPCFDEPDFKARFSVALVVDDGLAALSNAAEVGREKLGDGKVRVTFAETIRMSTYLVAAIVGPLEITAPVMAGNTPIRVAHVPGRGHLTSFALEAAAFALHFFEEYYAIPYPGEKLDLVALPDFAFGAMENLGCVTFRESSLLVDDTTVTQSEAMQVALTVVHEIAHMWFGDLVTMKWWNGIWLNEAFATFMEHAGVDAFRPEWRAWEDFALGRARAKDIDALSNTRPVEYEVRSPSDADGMFDVLTYEKGGSVVRMLEQWTGAAAFRAGVRHYLDRYRYENTETTDLWDALEHATGLPARRIMDSWIFQPGMPEIEAVRSGATVRLRQRRFTYTGDHDAAHWAIPVLVRAGTETQPVLLDDDAVEVAVGNRGPVVVHAGGEGYFRVLYPPDWRAELVESGACNALERFALVDDLWAAVVAGRVRASEFVDLALRFRGETELVVWRVLVARLREVARLLDGPALDRFRSVVADLVRPAAHDLGWEPAPDEPPDRRQLRGVLLDALGTLALDRDVAERARADHRDPEVVAAAISIVASTGSPDEFDDFVHRFEHASSPQEMVRYLYALASFPTEELVARACELALSERVRSQNAPLVMQRALRHRDHGRKAWELLRDAWAVVEERFPRTLVPRMFEGVVWLVDEASRVDLPAFVAGHPVPEGERVIAQHLERLHVNAALYDREHNFL